jgi:hypothetical protein
MAALVLAADNDRHHDDAHHLVSRATTDLQIFASKASSVEIKGTRAADLLPGMLFINIDADYTCSMPCSPLPRKVKGITNAPSGVRILSCFAPVGEMKKYAKHPFIFPVIKETLP